MAVKMIVDIFLSAHVNATCSEHTVPTEPQVSSLLCYTMHHQLGVIPIGEALIVIAVSSPNQKEAFMACKYLLEQVKLNILIWRKEVYESSESQ